MAGDLAQVESQPIQLRDSAGLSPASPLSFSIRENAISRKHGFNPVNHWLHQHRDCYLIL
jgi:hypothetical protein